MSTSAATWSSSASCTTTTAAHSTLPSIISPPQPVPSSSSSSTHHAASYDKKKKKTGRAEPRLYVPVEDLTAQDILLGKTARAMDHAGNRAYKAWVRHYEADYLRQKKGAKHVISERIVAEIQRAGGRFLDWDAVQQQWYVIARPLAVEKTSQALRDKRRSAHRRLGASSSSLRTATITAETGRRPSSQTNADVSTTTTTTTCTTLPPPGGATATTTPPPPLERTTTTTTHSVTPLPPGVATITRPPQPRQEDRGLDPFLGNDRTTGASIPPPPARTAPPPPPPAAATAAKTTTTSATAGPAANRADGKARRPTTTTTNLSEPGELYQQQREEKEKPPPPPPPPRVSSIIREGKNHHQGQRFHVQQALQQLHQWGQSSATTASSSVVSDRPGAVTGTGNDPPRTEYFRDRFGGDLLTLAWPRQLESALSPPMGVLPPATTTTVIAMDANPPTHPPKSSKHPARGEGLEDLKASYSKIQQPPEHPSPHKVVNEGKGHGQVEHASTQPNRIQRLDVLAQICSEGLTTDPGPWSGKEKRAVEPSEPGANRTQTGLAMTASRLLATSTPISHSPVTSSDRLSHKKEPDIAQNLKRAIDCLDPLNKEEARSLRADGVEENESEPVVTPLRPDKRSRAEPNHLGQADPVKAKDRVTVLTIPNQPSVQHVMTVANQPTHGEPIRKDGNELLASQETLNSAEACGNDLVESSATFDSSAPTEGAPMLLLISPSMECRPDIGRDMVRGIYLFRKHERKLSVNIFFSSMDHRLSDPSSECPLLVIRPSDNTVDLLEGNRLIREIYRYNVSRPELQLQLYSACDISTT